MDLQKQIERINEGYTVVEYEADGNDHDGFLYWVFCKNGWSGRSWELDSNLKQDIKNAKNEYYKKKYSKNKSNTKTTDTTKTQCNYNKVET